MADPRPPPPADPQGRTQARGYPVEPGHAVLDGRLLRLMGKKATASAGAVIAHHQAPLGAVLRSLRAPEKRAKSQGGRDASAITLLKRSGGATELTLPWWAAGEAGLEGSPMGVLADFKKVFEGEAGASRKAAYLTQGWALPWRRAWAAPPKASSTPPRPSPWKKDVGFAAAV